MRKKAEAMRGELESREGRIDDARRLKEREAQLAHVPTMKYNSALNMIAELAPPGWTYALKRAFIGDKYDATGWMAIEEEGWEIVPVSEHPRLKVSQSPYVGNELFANAFFYKGVVVCKMPTSILNKRKAYIAKQAANDLSSLKVNQYSDKMTEGGSNLKNGQFLIGSAGNWSNSGLSYPQAWEQGMDA